MDYRADSSGAASGRATEDASQQAHAEAVRGKGARQANQDEQQQGAPEDRRYSQLLSHAGQASRL